MTHKVKVFFRKIKNWLFSLSKWVKKNCKKLIVLFLAFLLLIFSVFTNNCNKASASTMASNTAFVVTPTVPSEKYFSGTYYTVDVMPFYITYRDTSNTYSIGLPRATSPTTGLVYRDVYLTANSSSVFYANDVQFVLASLLANGTTEFKSITCDFTLETSMSFNDILENGNYCVRRIGAEDGVTSDGFLYFLYYDYLDNLILKLSIADISLDGVTSQKISAFNIIRGGELPVDPEIGSAYNEGYANGYNEGLNDAESMQPWGVLSNMVTAFFDIKLFGDFGIDILLYIAFGFVALTLVIKILR